MLNYRLAAITVVFTAVSFAIGFTVLVGCAMWEHVAGITMGGLLVLLSVYRYFVLVYVRKHGGPLPGLVAFTSGIPDGIVKEAATINDYGEVGSELPIRERSRCYNIAKVARIVLEVLLFGIVVIQLWARFGAPNNPHWIDFADVPPCAPSSHNCNYEEFALDAPEDQSTVCTAEWIKSTPRTKTLRFTFNTSEPIFAHIRVLQRLFPFPDDFAVSLNGTTAEVHSKSRLGTKDFGVNKRRIDDYRTYMESCIHLHTQRDW